MTAVQQYVPETTVNYRELVPDVTFRRLVNRIVADEGIELPLAEEIMEAALCFLSLSVENGGGLSPSPLVDIGWHTFILYTREYAAFCQRIAGRFIHHEPNDNPDAPQAPGGIQRTIDYMRSRGVPYNELLWTGRLTNKKAEIILSGTPLADGDCDGGSGPAKLCNSSNCSCT